ncbi:PREDICTED: zinc finger protein 26-like [Priapulus caudatus]|uniref:Zinc finger protein 26-like n=1 Tax=Priapulus caudatus TaxID=37621 RepID=A0ABM1E5E5_PRICU|nr:PREDICTED: zinc finger protein 26-like [Priapulus caudatus]
MASKKAKLGCDVCGDDHATDDCPQLGPVTEVCDAQVQSRARLTLPAQLQLNTSGKGVVANSVITARTRFGPFEAPRVNIKRTQTSGFDLMVFNGNKTILLQIDIENECNWMCLVQPATCSDEQNLMALQMKDDIFYITTRDISAGEQLKVWYAPAYAEKLQKPPNPEPLPLTLPDTRKIPKSANTVKKAPRPKSHLHHFNIHCKKCNVVSPTRPDFVAHLRNVHGTFTRRKQKNPEVEEGAERPSAADNSPAVSEEAKPTDPLTPEQSNSTVDSSEAPSTSYIPRSRRRNVKPKRFFDEDTKPFERSDSANFTPVLSMCDLDDEGVNEAGVILEVRDREEIDEEGEKKDSTEELATPNSGRLGDDTEDINWTCDVCDATHETQDQLRSHVLDDHAAEFTCADCQLTFLRQEKLQNHLCEDSASSGSFFCADCPKLFANQRLLDRHTTCHGASGAYYCETCHACFATRRAMTDHSCRCEDGEAFRCEICGDRFVNELYLQRHLAATHERRFACDTCEKTFVLEKRLTVHAVVCEGLRSIAQNAAAQCRRCLQIFTDGTAFERHASSHTHPHECARCRRSFAKSLSRLLHACQRRGRGGRGSFACAECGRAFDDAAKLLRHARVHERAPFECEYCRRVFARKDLLLRHGREYLVEPRVCETCGVSFTSKSALGIHAKTHGDKTHACELCAKRFHRSDTLKIHYGVHTNERNFQCAQCGNRLKSKAALRVHLMSHTGLRPFTCDICGQPFAQKGNMEKHREKHDPNRCYKCGCCEKTFADKVYARVHELEHTATTRFGCKLCHKTFVKLYLLNNHVREAHSSETYVCEFCGMAIKMKHSLKRHMLRKHADARDVWQRADYFKTQRKADIDDGNAAPTVVRVDSLNAGAGAAGEVVTITDEAGNLIETGFEQILLLSNLATEDGAAVAINPEQMEAIGEALQAVESLEHGVATTTMTTTDQPAEVAVPLGGNDEIAAATGDGEGYVAAETAGEAATTGGSTTLSININGVQTTAVIPVENPTQEQIRDVVQRIMQLPQIARDHCAKDRWQRQLRGITSYVNNLHGLGTTHLPLEF